MADILIRGMEMPISCEKCPFNDYEQGFCFAICKFGNHGWPEFSLIVGDMKTRHPNCPLLPLPEGHGDLIDKTEAYDRIAEQEGGNYIDMDSVGKGLEECQIFVPAEGGNIDGN